MKSGNIDISQLDVPPEKHEFDTAKYFAALGKNIVFLKLNNPGGITPPIRS